MKKHLLALITISLFYSFANAQTDYCSIGKFYDSGGPDFFYGSTDKYYETMYPSSTDYYVSVTFNFFDVRSIDYLEIYDGPNRYGTIIGRYSGTELEGITINATNVSGALTFRFYASGGGNRPGWDADVTCVEKPSDCSIGKFNDTGGANGYYGNVNYTVTFTPDSQDEYIGVTFNSFSINDWNDYIKVYDGPDSSSPLIGEYTGFDLNGGVTLKSTDPSGTLTFNVVSQESSVPVYYPGWDADIICFKKPDCAPPINVSVKDISKSEALVSWTPYGTETSWNLEYGLTGFDPGTGTTVVSDATEFALVDLEPETDYDIYITVNCIEGGIGNPSEVYSFSTNNSNCIIEKFYDTGGPTGDYSNSEDYYKIFRTEDPNSVVQIKFNYIDLRIYDFLRIYDGSGTYKVPLLAEHSSVALTDVTYTSTNGALTITFKSNSTGIDFGWDADVLCVDKEALSTNKLDNIPDLKIYPNPSNGEFQVNTGNVLINNIEVFSMTGKLVFEQKNISESEYFVKLPSQLSANMYFLKIETEKGIAFKKIVKN